MSKYARALVKPIYQMNYKLPYKQISVLIPKWVEKFRDIDPDCWIRVKDDSHCFMWSGGKIMQLAEIINLDCNKN